MSLGSDGHSINRSDGGLPPPFNNCIIPEDAAFKGYEEVVIQDIKIITDNVLFR